MAVSKTNRYLKETDMACNGCEERREWIKHRTDEAKQRAKKLIARLNNTDDKDSGTKQPTDRTVSK